MARLLLINGPNLNLLGTREPEIYGADTLDDIENRAREQVLAAGHALDVMQSNAEHEIVEAIHAARRNATGYVVINPGAFTHTSVAIRDAFSGTGVPFIEVHLSNVHAREPFRHHSYLSDVAAGVVIGFGAYGYEMALAAALRKLESDQDGG